MSRSVFILDRYYVAASLGVFLCLSAAAQQTTPTGSTKDEASKAVPTLLPFPHMPKAPVERFRALLTMTPQERQQFVASRSPEEQKLILAKVREYEGLTAEQRELRLRVTELRWYLVPLLNAPATNRVVQLDSIPDTIRPLVDDRLREWDKLSTRAQKQVLENEQTVRFCFELAATSPAQRATTVANIPEATRAQIESGINRWQGLPEGQRQEILNHFDEFFGLTTAEQQKTLNTLSESERIQIEKTLHTFEELTPAQRAQCLRSFQKFASLTLDERRQFLKNAERWKLMSPSERQSWRNLVYNLSHQPLPPGFTLPPAPQYRPPSLSAPKASSTLVTNLN